MRFALYHLVVVVLSEIERRAFLALHGLNVIVSKSWRGAAHLWRLTLATHLPTSTNTSSTGYPIHNPIAILLRISSLHYTYNQIILSLRR